MVRPQIYASIAIRQAAYRVRALMKELEKDSTEYKELEKEIVRLKKISFEDYEKEVEAKKEAKRQAKVLAKNKSNSATKPSGFAVTETKPIEKNEVEKEKDDLTKKEEKKPVGEVIGAKVSQANYDSLSKSDQAELDDYIKTINDNKPTELILRPNDKIVLPHISVYKVIKRIKDEKLKGFNLNPNNKNYNEKPIRTIFDYTVELMQEALKEIYG